MKSEEKSFQLKRCEPWELGPTLCKLETLILRIYLTKYHCAEQEKWFNKSSTIFIDFPQWPYKNWSFWKTIHSMLHSLPQILRYHIQESTPFHWWTDDSKFGCSSCTVHSLVRNYMYVHIVPSYLNLAFKSKVRSAHCIKSQGVSGININQNVMISCTVRWTENLSKSRWQGR